MSRLQQTLVSTETRQLPLRLRADLQARRHKYLGLTHWILKDPVGMKYFRFQEEEYALLKMLDGKKSLEVIQQEFEKRFAPRRLRLGTLQQFVSRLHAAGLILMDRPGQGKQLKEMGDQATAKQRRAARANIFAIRFPGYDPDRLLEFLYRYTAWFFSPLSVAGVLLVALSALASIVINFETFSARLPSASLFYGPSNMHWLILSMIFCKILHELGHGLTCKHFGGECHQMGFMLLFFAPAMYCDVSDSWLLPQKWRRMAIGAGGMYVEIFIAGLATCVWWLSEPGLLNSICLSLMLLTSVSTILVNANPLLRFDGYFILSDYMEIPNLAQKSRDLLRHFLVKWCLGIELPLGRQMSAPGQVWLLVYAIASAIYRWFVIFAALWFLHTALEAYDLEVLGRIAAFIGLNALLVFPLWQTVKLLYVPGRISQMKTRRALISSALVATAALFVFAVPMPRSVQCPAIIAVREAETVYARVPGKLATVAVAYGESVAAGSELATLANDDLEFAIAELTGQVEELEAQVQGLNKERLVYQESGRRIDSVKETLAMVKQQLAERIKDRDLLVRKSTRDGIVLHAPSIPRRKLARNQPSSSGDPLEPHNLGMHLAADDVLCQIGDPQQLELIILIDQSARELVGVGAKVYAWPASTPFQAITSEISEISRSETVIGPRSLGHKHGGSVATQSSQSGEETLLTATYQARAPIDNRAGTILAGLRCQVKIQAPPQTWGLRLWRWAEETFRFRA